MSVQDIINSGYDLADYRTLKSRWRKGRHVGSAKPVMRGYCRVVKLERRYRTVPAGQIYAQVPGAPKGIGPNQVWMGKWKPKTQWRKLPNILSFRGEQDFDANGVQTATIELDNVALTAQLGPTSLAFHAIERGYYAPFRGFKPKGRPAVGEENRWFDFLNDKSCQIVIVAGYGDVAFPIFDGLVNDMDITSRPDRITLTCRDAGQVITDQHVFSNAKARSLKDPIVFADRQDADNKEDVGLSAEASSGPSARFVLDDRDSTQWVSGDYDHAKPADMPWLQIGLPNGRYESFKLKPAFEGMEVYVAIQARDANAPGGNGAKRYRDDHLYSDGEWIDEGNGTIPGTGIPWVKHIDSAKASERTYPFQDLGYGLGDDSKLRLYFTNLDNGNASQGSGRAYRAGVIRLQGVNRKLDKAAETEQWILVDDLSDVVKTVLQWCGINDWEIESTGVRLRSNATFNRGNYLIDIIKAAADQVGYVFYIKPPPNFNESDEALEDTDEDISIGIAVFRQNQAMKKKGDTFDPVELVSDETILQTVNARFTDEPLAYNIRVRGRKLSKKKGGRTLGGDDTSRAMYVYRPPWATGAKTASYYGGSDPHRELTDAPDYRNGNIKKYVVFHDDKLRSVDDCKIAALFIAFREALESAQATIEFPGFPPIQLDHQLAIFDVGTGLSTRIWVAARQVEYQAGPQGHFKMSVGGSLIDLPDITAVRAELVQSLNDSNYNPGLSKWEITNHQHSYRNTGD